MLIGMVNKCETSCHIAERETMFSSGYMCPVEQRLYFHEEQRKKWFERCGGI
jgi:hypothetical protein